MLGFLRPNPWLMWMNCFSSENGSRNYIQNFRNVLLTQLVYLFSFCILISQFCTFLNFAPKSKQSHVFLTKITPNSQMYFHVDIIQCVSTNFNFSSTTYISQRNMHQSISSYFSIQNKKIRQLNQICFHEHASEIVVRY